MQKYIFIQLLEMIFDYLCTVFLLKININKLYVLNINITGVNKSILIFLLILMF